MEQAGRYTFEGQRQLLPGSRGHVLYQVSFKVSPGCQLVILFYFILFYSIYIFIYYKRRTVHEVHSTAQI